MSFLFSLSSRRFLSATVNNRQVFQKVQSHSRSRSAILLILLQSYNSFVKMGEIDKIPDVVIDRMGVFKYILVEIRDKTTDNKKKVVWGTADLNYHADIYDNLTETMAKYPNLEASSLGGGFIMHSPEKKNLKLFGTSQGLGLADHRIGVDILKKKYTDYEITWSNDHSP